MGSVDNEDRQRLEGIVSAVDGAREQLLAYDPPWVDPRYEEMRAEVDRALRQAQLGVRKFFEELVKVPEVEA
jgi:hypothetical protein